LKLIRRLPRYDFPNLRRRDDIELLQNIELANAESVVETLKLTKNRGSY